ncbi:hypothetical protein QQG09_00415 [Melissococcus plutonius]|nr:hypothetical protein [Melissococcus plutonius]BAL62758.1 hypothetical protein MPD5_1558 [Melissococcus plutonius DAT561]MCV2498677.1 hypothetical protein [Melissococcus plutonius]MCV2500982.1 hypothetical protein [Melissococcus plutonius]MCV2504655.1 hypothetical protein [Melissococcus plutonius]MCV2507115.1 hypothetical protein [Melissococcus plutonius]
MYQIRIYTMKDRKSAEEYLNIHWKRHLVSLPKYGITVHFVSSEENKEQPRVFVLVSSQTGNIGELNEKYMQSNDFLQDMAGFDMGAILSVEEIDVKEYFNQSNK